MIKKLLGISLAFVLTGTGIYFAKDFMVFGKTAYVKSLLNKDNDDDEKDGIAGAMAFHALRTMNPLTGVVDTGAAYAAYQQAEMQSFNKTGLGTGLLQWAEMGPDNIGGRCRAIIIDKDSNNVVYAAGVTGGIFKSNDAGATWKKMGSTPLQNQNASALCQGADGAIYYGTGENAFLIPNSVKASGYSAPGYFGEGIFKSTDHGNTFTQLASTDPNTKGSQWMDVSFMAADPTNANRIYAGNDASLMISNDGGTTWSAVTGAWHSTGACKDIRLSKDGSTVYVIMAFGGFPGGTYQIWRSTDRASTWTEIGTTGNNGGVPTSASSMMLAISPSNENTIYVCVAAPGPGYGFQGIYRSDNQGTNFSTVIPGGTGQGAFNPFNGQGFYDNCIAVDPTNNNKVYFGGLDLYSVEQVNGTVQTTQLSNWQSAQGIPNYVHADQHIIIFDRTKPYPSAYFGCDGGVFKSTDIAVPGLKTTIYGSGYATFGNADYGFNTTQFYGFGVGADYPTDVIAGAQDNGEVFVNASGFTQLDGASIDGGDAGYSEISKLNPKFYLEEYTDGNISRSFNNGGVWAPFMTAKGELITSPGNSYTFMSWLSLWESADDPTSVDSVVFFDPVNAHAAGSTITVQSANDNVSFEYTLTKNLPAKQNLTVQDITQSKLFVAASSTNNPIGEIWMTKDILKSSITSPVFYRIAVIPGFVPLMIRSTLDGNTIFAAGLLNGSAAVYRITGLSGKIYKYPNIPVVTPASFVPDSIGIVTTQLFTTSAQVGTGVAIDDNDPNHILFCTGTYDRTNSHVFECDNAMSANPTFTDISSNLPSLPIYDVLIDSHNPNIYLCGTDLGVYSTVNKGSSWKEENSGMDRVPVSMLRQQKFLDKSWDGPYIYASTFGRGMFYSGTLTSGINEQNGNGIATGHLLMDLYPNPVHGSVNVNVTLPTASQVNVYIYNMQGKLLSTNNYGGQPSGNHIYNIPTGNLNEGTYFVKVSAGGLEQTSKMLVLN